MVGLLGNFGGTGGILGGGGGPLFGTNGQLAQFRQQNPNQWMNMAAGLLGGRNLQQSLAGAAQGMAMGAPMDAQTRDRAQRIQAIGNWIDEQQKAGKAIPPATAKLFSAYPEIAERYAIGQIMPETPKPTDDMREYDAARQQGFTGTLQDWITSNRRAGATTVNVGPTGIDYGDAPKDMSWARNPDGTVALDKDPSTGLMRPRAVPIAGGPMEQAQTAAASKAADRTTSRDRSADVVVTDIDRAISLIENAPVPVTGMWSISSALPGTPAYDTAALIETIKANAGFDRLQAMRDASPTGGALGPVSDFENKNLQNAIGNLSMSQSQQQLVDNLARVQNLYLDIVHGAGNGPSRKSMSYDQPATVTTPAPATPAGGDGWTDLGNGVRIRPRQ